MWRTRSEGCLSQGTSAALGVIVAMTIRGQRWARWAWRCGATMPMMALAASAALASGEAAIVPLTCSVSQGRLAVAPSTERTHPIIANRSSHAFTTCAPGKPPRCRTWMVHKFEAVCDGHRVSWLGMAGAALERDDPRVRVIANRFTLRMPPGWSDGSSAANANVVVFPAGYAPALNIPLRFTRSGGPHETVMTWERSKVERPARVASVEPVAVAPAAPRLPAPQGEFSAVSSWVTTVEPVTKVLGTTHERVGVIAAAVVLAWGLLMLVRRRFAGPAAGAAGALPLQALAAPTANERADVEAGQSGATPSEGETYAAHCARMISNAVANHEAMRDRLASIESGSLRDVLHEDLAKVQSALLAPRLAADIASGSWASVEVAVTGAMVDLDRIERIIDSVSTTRSTSVLHNAEALPATAYEAFQLLGVTPEASPVAVKKIVDGLRLSWHPDHAKNETDRSIREARLKQINVAWDLIQDQQKAA